MLSRIAAATSLALLLAACSSASPPPDQPGPGPAPAGDPCAGVSLPPCPPACDAGAGELAGKPCPADGQSCGNNIGDTCTCQGGTWQCAVHAPLGPGCNLVCR